MAKVDITFVTPALNEEQSIGMVLQAIQRECSAAELKFESIVVDNGSKDRTKDVAHDCGARVLDCPQGTIAAMRNLAVTHANGSVLVFLDADVELGAGWGERMRGVLPGLVQGRLISGSPCITPDALPVPFRRWFDGLALKANPRYIGTGHMVLSTKFFAELGGFDSTKTTGEDYDICQRAWAAGGVVSSDLQLRAIHHGFPVTVRQFVSRESWHGTSDFKSLKAFCQSSTAVAAAIFLMLALAILVAGFFGGPKFAFTVVGLTFIFIYACVVVKFPGAPLTSHILNVPLMAAYLAGRALSLIRVVLSCRVHAPKAGPSVT